MQVCTGSGLSLFELGQLGVVSARALWRDALQVDVGVGEAHGQVVGVAGVDRQVDGRNTNRHCRRRRVKINQSKPSSALCMHGTERLKTVVIYLALLLQSCTLVVYWGLQKGAGMGTGDVTTTHDGCPRRRARWPA